MSAEPINKTMDRDDLAREDCAAVIERLADLKRRMAAAGVGHSSWYGRLAGPPSLWDRANRGMDYEPWPGWTDDDAVPWFLLWEICWLVTNTPISPGQRVLDLGGASSLMSCYLADLGCDVTAVDLDADLVDNAGRLADAMGWAMRAIQADMAELDLPDDGFDHIFSVCVLEHLPWQRRAKAAGLWPRLLRQGGYVGLTFDYRCPHCDTRLGSPRDLEAQLIAPSGLHVRGNGTFHDSGVRYLESPYYFGFSRLARRASMLSQWLGGQIRTKHLRLDHRHYTFGALFLAK